MANSPCVRNCCLNQHDCCLGCGRHVDEIIEWHQADGGRREQILQRAAERLAEKTIDLNFKRPAADLSE